MRIAAWNAERCKYLPESAALLAGIGADVVLLSELDVGMARSGNRHTPRELARALGSGYLFGVEYVELGLGDNREKAWHAGQSNQSGLHGNGILSKAGTHGLLNELGKLAPIPQREVAVTSGGNLPVQYIIHAAAISIGPDANYAVTADDVRDEKVKVLHAIATPDPEKLDEMAVRAQYTAGDVGGETAAGYLQEDGVPPGSNTETFAALRLEIQNWRWAGVPFYLRTGKRLARKVTEIAVTLKPVPHLAFKQEGSLGVRPNQLILTMQPNEGVSLSLGAKIPGTRMRIRPVYMEFLYGTSFLSQSPEAYERLIMDAMRGDATLFTRNDEVEAQWRICDPVVKAWETTPGPLPKYESGSQGPAEAEELLRDGDRWRAI